MSFCTQVLNKNSFLRIKSIFTKNCFMSQKINHEMDHVEIDKRINEWKVKVDLTKLNIKEKIIHKKHLEAIMVK